MLEAAELAAKIERHLALGSDWVDVREDRDNIDALVRQARLAANSPSAPSWVMALLHFAKKPDPGTATAALLALRELQRHVPAPAILEIIQANPGHARLRPARPDVDEPDLRSALVVFLAGCERQLDGAIAAFLGRELADGRIHASLIRELAKANPAALVANATAWATTTDTGALFAFSTHENRVDFARALAPWPGDAIERVTNGWAARNWSDADRRALARAMAGAVDAPYLPGAGPLP